MKNTNSHVFIGIKLIKNDQFKKDWSRIKIARINKKLKLKSCMYTVMFVFTLWFCNFFT
jgi:hypothetical protein